MVLGKISRPVGLIAMGLFLSSCAGENPKSRYLLAERLWSNKEYAAAVREFERVAKKEPKTKLGLQALYRAAMTQSLFLSEYPAALEKFRAYIHLAGDTPVSWTAQKQIGEILFNRLKNYVESNQHYQKLLELKPKAVESALFRYRLAKGYFHLAQFDRAIEQYREIAQQFSKSRWAERAEFEIALAQYTQGEQQPGDGSDDAKVYRKAIRLFEGFVQKYPNSRWVPEAKFWIAACYEEVDDLNRSYELYESVRTTYPSPQVVEIRLTRIKERMLQRAITKKK